MNNEESQIPKLESVDFWYVNVKISALRAALDLHIWDRIAEGTKNAEEMASREGWDPVGTRILLDALCGMGLLAKDSKGYCLTRISDFYFVKSKSTYMGDVRKAQLTWEEEGSLAKAIRTGKRPITKRWTDSELQKVWAGHLIPFRLSPDRYMEYFEDLWPTLGVTGEVYVLDVACGPAMETFSLALKTSSRITLQDWPEVLEEGARIAEKLAVARQIEYLAGDWESVDFGKDCYDVVVLGSIAHFYGPKKVGILFSKAKKALKPGGMAVVSGPLPDESRCTEEFPLVSAIWVYATSEEGCMYTYAEYSDLLEKVGFQNIELVQYKKSEYIRARKP
ncbi:MAG: methyltransferase domain-containing protein [Theionarchaea archaeon]|nr:methyltransferase domain-containing protein [Theionarchaea archaeon]